MDNLDRQVRVNLQKTPKHMKDKGLLYPERSKHWRVFQSRLHEDGFSKKSGTVLAP